MLYNIKINLVKQIKGFIFALLKHTPKNLNVMAYRDPNISDLEFELNCIMHDFSCDKTSPTMETYTAKIFALFEAHYAKIQQQKDLETSARLKEIATQLRNII